MIRALAVVVALVACNGTAERPTGATGPAGPRIAATGDAAPRTATPDPGPPPARDCTVLAPAVNRIITDEIAEIRRTRPPEVAPIAEAEATTTGAILVGVMPVLCEQDKWSGAYTACIATAKVRDDARACQIHLTADQQAHLESEIKAGTVATNSIGIPECDQWQTITLRMESCQQFPPESRQAIRQAVEQSMDAWRKAVVDEASRQMIANACQQAVEAMKQSMTAMGCPVGG